MFVTLSPKLLGGIQPLSQMVTLYESNIFFPCAHPSIMRSPPKPLGGIQPNLLHYFPSWLGYARVCIFPSARLSVRHTSICPLRYLLNPWAEFNQTCYTTVPHGNGVGEQVRPSVMLLATLAERWDMRWRGHQLRISSCLFFFFYRLRTKHWVNFIYRLRTKHWVNLITSIILIQIHAPGIPKHCNISSGLVPFSTISRDGFSDKNGYPAICSHVE